MTRSHMLFLFPRNASFPPTRGDSNRVYSIARLGVDSDIQTSVFFLGDGRPFSLSQVQFYPVSGRITADPSVAGRLTFLGLARDLLRFISVVIVFARHDKRERIILYGHTPVGGLVAAIVKAVTGISFVYDPHDWHYESWAVYHRSLDALKRGCAIVGYRILGFVLPRTSDAVVCVTESMMRNIKGADRKLLIPNMVEDFPSAQPMSREESGLVVFTGHLAAYQGLFNLIRAFQLVKAKLGGSSLLIVGDGEDMPTAKNLVQRLGLNDIVFTGAVSHEEAYEYTRRASVCVAPFLPLPFVETSCPIKLLEYVAMNKKIVVTDIPEFRDMLKGYENARFAAATPESLAQSIIESLQAHSSSDDTRNCLPIVGRTDLSREAIRSLSNLAVRSSQRRRHSDLSSQKAS